MSGGEGRRLAFPLLLLTVTPLVLGIIAAVLMFQAADQGDTADTVAWGVVVLALWLS